MRQVVSLLVVVWLGAGPMIARAEPEPTNVEQRARERYKRGLSLFNAGLFDAAAAEFEAGFQLKALPLFLFNAAQAQRRGGHAQQALDSYRRYVLAEPLGAEAEEATGHIRDLDEKLRAERATTPPAAALVATTAPAPPRHWSRDPLGATLLGSGAALVVTGAILLGVGGAWLSAPIDNFEAFDRAKQGNGVAAGGGVLLAVGVGLGAGATTRYLLLRRRQK